MAAAQQFETITMPEGGLGSFFTSNIDEIDDNVLMFGRAGGINSMKEVADRMARMGREGDNFVVHASEKEVMVPQEVAEKNPELVGQIKQAIAAEGADPEAYVVGSDRNSINPYTGQREFFLKKLVKGVKKVFKKAAKIILPVALNVIFPGMGTIASAAIGAGLGGLVQGESFKDALKSAALGGLTAGVASGVSGALSGQGFLSGVKGALPSQDVGFFKPRFKMDNAPGVFEPFKTGRQMDSAFQQNLADAAQAASLNKYQLAAQEIDKAKKAGITLSPADALAQVSANAAGTAGKSTLLGTAVKYGLPSLLALGAAGGFDEIPAGEIDIDGFNIDDTSETRLADNPEKYSTGVPTGPPNFTTATQAIYSGQPITSASFGPSQGSYNPIQPSRTYANLTPTGAGTNPMMGTMVPSSGGVSTYVPPAPVQQASFQRPVYGYDAAGNPIYTPNFGAPITPSAQQEPVMAAAGGPMDLANDPRLQKARNFPRRTGQIQGPGTETSDDIPAMLSDGEFVMTAQAVRGAGNGSREQGFKKMYDIMRAFEGGAVA